MTNAPGCWTPAGRYLKRRGLWHTPVPRVLSHHPALPYRHDDGRYTYHPALTAAIQGPDGRVVSLHRIYLTSDGFKAAVPAAQKFMSPTTIVNGAVIATTMNGAAIGLDAATDELVVAEGVETCPGRASDDGYAHVGCPISNGYGKTLGSGDGSPGGDCRRP